MAATAQSIPREKLYIYPSLTLKKVKNLNSNKCIELILNLYFYIEASVSLDRFKQGGEYQNRIRQSVSA